MPDVGLPSDDAELLAIVKSDLAFLEEEWDESIDEQSLRRTSTVLRNLLVYDLFGKAWRLVVGRGQPEIEAVDLHRVLVGLRLPKVAFATREKALAAALKSARPVASRLLRQRLTRPTAHTSPIIVRRPQARPRERRIVVRVGRATARSPGSRSADDSDPEPDRLVAGGVPA